MTEPAAGHRGHVLVVDDEPSLLDALAMLLELDGFRVTTARDGEAAFEALLASRPDVIYTDLMMPRCDGVRLARRVRANPELASIPIVLTSAALVQARTFDDLVDAFVPKGGSVERLIEVLDAQVARARQR